MPQNNYHLDELIVLGDADDFSIDDELTISTITGAPSSSTQTGTKSSNNTVNQSSSHGQPLNSRIISPGTDIKGNLVSQEVFWARLESIDRKAPLFMTCKELDIKVPAQASLARLRTEVLKHWYPHANQPTPPIPKQKPSTKPKIDSQQSRSAVAISSAEPSSHKRARSHVESAIDGSAYLHVNDKELLKGMAAPGIDLDGDEDDEGDVPNVLSYVADGLDDDGEEDGDDDDEDDDFEQSRKRMRLEADQAWQTNRREGGKRAQESVTKSWNKFLDGAIFSNEVKDRIVDEHSLLKFIDWTFNRPKLDRRGNEMQGSLVGASQIKKMFFGVLRIRKTQEAANPTLKTSRIAVTNIVYDFVKTKMSLALKRVRNGLVPSEDMPDIVANTALEKLSDEQMNRLNISFLEHPQTRVALIGHLSWTAQNASGKRGDDIRSMRIRELQPYEFLHPNKETQIDGIVGLQGEEKVAAKGMKAVSQPALSTWILHRDPLWDPIGSIMRQQYWLHDVFMLEDKMEIDWTKNRSWGHVRLMNGGQLPDAPYNYQNLYNVYCQAFNRAGFQSRIKQHLPRKVLGHRQESMGVASTSTAKLGWYQQDTYHNVYAPQIPKDAVLAAHGYKEHEGYDPVYRLVSVPEEFLRLVIPKAEEILATVQEAQTVNSNLQGCANYWTMIIRYRAVFFQTSAAIYQVAPNSSIFRLPALCNRDVINWMTHRFPSEYAALKAKAGSPVNLMRIQDQLIRQALEQNRATMQELQMQTARAFQVLSRRTQMFSPSKFDSESYYEHYQASSSMPILSAHTPLPPRVTIACSPTPLHNVPDLGTTSPRTRASTPPLPLFSFPPTVPFTPPRQRPVNVPSSSPSSLQGPHPTSPVPSSPANLSFNSENEDVQEQVLNDHAGIYRSPDRSIRAYADPTTTPRVKSSVDLALPDVFAFQLHSSSMHGIMPIYPPVFGTKALSWDEVLDLVKQPNRLWEAWAPNYTLDSYPDVASVWRCYNAGERKIDKNTKEETGIKPPLRLVEQRFGAKWRNTPSARKRWSRFLAIPDHITAELAKGRNVSAIIAELENMRIAGRKSKQGLNQLGIRLEKLRKTSSSSLTTTPPGTPPVPADDALLLSSSGSTVMVKSRKPAVNRRPKPKKN